MERYFGIKKTHQLMIERLADYITSQYFGDNQLLVNASNNLLCKEGIIYQKPFIETSTSYCKIQDGLMKMDIDKDVKAVFKRLIEEKLGFFNNPFKHQVEALENFSKGKNLFVAIGPGSGKTECFIWPIIYKLLYEAIHNKDSRKQRGVRTIIIYPMNALVSDQISRLRSIIGDKDNKFINIFHEACGQIRRPQFGMYTGRTPYSGNKPIKKSNLDIALSYTNSYLVSDNLTREEKEEQLKDIEGLKKINKYPSKNMENLVNALKNDDLLNYDSKDDAELLLRFEMQKNTPDILITNYSMLEYMLLRKIEANIWDDTINWLNLSGDNKLLIVLDEAHMYAGASGGEVALLIRRLFSKLGITHKKIQFIMTSASMPNETQADHEYVTRFAEDISGCKFNTFSFLFGNKQLLKSEVLMESDIEKLANLSFSKIILDEETINNNISLFAKEIFNVNLSSEHRLWLYNNLTKYEPFLKLSNNSQGKAIAYDDLLFKTMGRTDEIGEKAFENLLFIAPLARDKNNNVLFPVRIHMFFRGLNGIYACLNPNCSHHNDGNGIHLGNLLTQNVDTCPYCNSKVFELVNDRRCGALYIKTFILRASLGNTEIMCWNKRCFDENNEMIEYPLYIIPDGFDIKNRVENTEVGYFDFISGKLYSENVNEKTCLKVLKSVNIENEEFPFKKCPHCGKAFKFISLHDFKVKGNIPFYSLIRSQFESQPMIKKPNHFAPNGGRKILLFSDSRQSAAVLARDMTKISDIESFRKTIFLAMEKVLKENENEVPLSSLYPAFLEVCVEQNLRFFYGSELEKFQEDKLKLLNILERDKKRGKKTSYARLCSEFNTPCKMYQADLIEIFCSPTINFSNLGLGYISPLDDKVEDILYDLDIDGLNEEEFKKIFLAFAVQTFTDSFSFDNSVEENVRKTVKYIKGNRYGFRTYNSYINEAIKRKYESHYHLIYDKIVDEFYRKEDGYYFLNIQTVKFVLNSDNTKNWIVCDKCGTVFPFDIEGRCAICDNANIKKQTVSDIKKIDYWRKPIIGNVEVKAFNTEEHSGQLSFKDQKISTWAKTEDYEMRFQDVNVEKYGKSPIDILSCTTTMEVGIDIGSLIAIGLRNVPPLRENYQQRAGRAGRRGSSISTISVYCQGGPHDSYYFDAPQKIINGKLRRPWIDIDNEKILYRHFNLTALTKFFERINESLFDISFERFKLLSNEFFIFLENLSFNSLELEEYFRNSNIIKYKENLINDLKKFLKSNYDENENVFSLLYSSGILPTYSFPLDVVDFNIEDDKGKTALSPSRGIDIAINEYAPGKTIVVDKKIYKSGGIYSPIRHKEQKSIYSPAEPYFDETNGHYKKIYNCSNLSCGWFSTVLPKDNKCPFCGSIVNENYNKMLIPWGFAPINAREMYEGEADNELSFTDEPCYSATPSEDLVETKYNNLMIANRKNEEIIILNKGIGGKGFDICRDCGAAQISQSKSLKDNGINAPFTINGKKVNCEHKNVETNVFLGATFRTDMFFMQIKLDMNRITSDESVLKSASYTLCEVLKLSTSRILDISYNDLSLGTRIRRNKNEKYLDIYFYDNISSGAGYSTQIESYLSEIFSHAFEILNSNDNSDICNFWNQRIQHLFNKKYALDLLNRIIYSKLPSYFTQKETELITSSLVNILLNEFNITAVVDNCNVIVKNNLFKIVPALIKRNANELSDFDLNEKLPIIVENIIKKSING